MIETIGITALIVFVIVGLWSKYAYTKSNKNVYVMFEALEHELNNIAKEAGYKNIDTYWEKSKGKDYAITARQNFDNTMQRLRNG